MKARANEHGFGRRPCQTSLRNLAFAAERLVDLSLSRACGQQIFEHSGQRDLNSGRDKRPDLDSARNAIDDVLKPPFDLVR